MKVRIEESREGEFAESTAPELREKASMAVGQVLTELGYCGDLLSKALPRGGEIQVLEELTQMTVRAYESRMDHLRKAIESKVKEAIEEGIED